MVPFGCVASFDNDSSRCFEKDAWCRKYLDDYGWAETLAETGDGSFQYADAYAENGFMAYTFCEVAKQARASALYHLKGTFEVTRHGNNGAVYDIDLKAKLNTATMVTAVVSADVEVDADSIANSTSYAFMYTDLNAFCNFLGTGLLYNWLCVDISHVASAYSSATAKAYSSAFSKAIAGAGTRTSQETSVYVEGSNLQKFTASIAVGASSFAKGKSLADVFAKSYTEAFAETYVSICMQNKAVACNNACRGDSICNESCTAWDCDSSYANASAYVDIVAQAYGKEYAKSSARASVSVAAKAYFTRTNGKNRDKEKDGDIINVSQLGSGFAEAGALTSCD